MSAAPSSSVSHMNLPRRPVPVTRRPGSISRRSTELPRTARGRGVGPNKKLAEQEAARVAVAFLRDHPEAVARQG